MLTQKREWSVGEAERWIVTMANAAIDQFDELKDLP
jgi:hypothetical protein